MGRSKCDFFLGKIGGGEIDRDALGRQRQPAGMQRRLHPLPAFGDRLVRQADDLHADLSGRDHHLHFDGNAFDPLKGQRIDARNHVSPDGSCTRSG